MSCVYGLYDPETDELRYVGKTSRWLQLRLRLHLRPSSLRRTTRCAEWLRSLSEKPQIRVIEIVDDSARLNERERFWIAYSRATGCDLTNTTPGGEGLTSEEWTPELRRKISLHNDAYWTMEHREEQAARTRAFASDPQERRARSERARYPRTQAHRDAISRGMQQRYPTAGRATGARPPYFDESLTEVTNRLERTLLPL